MPIQVELEEKYLENITVMAQYGGIAKKLVTTLKYQGVKDVGQTLARMIYYATPFPQTDLITAVPLHPKRKKERGFNQAAEIAQELGEITQTPFASLLKRVKHSRPQAAVSDKTQRLSRLQNTFEIREDTPSAKSVLLIDDVTTTGTTLNECARVLKQNGYQKIYGLVIAHGN